MHVYTKHFPSQRITTSPQSHNKLQPQLYNLDFEINHFFSKYISPSFLSKSSSPSCLSSPKSPTSPAQFIQIAPRTKTSSQNLKYNLANDNNLLLLIKHLLIKNKKTQKELEIMNIYLSTQTNFKSIISPLVPNLGNNLDYLIYKLSNEMKIEYCQANAIVYKQGDKNDKLYLVLEGDVTILNTFLMNVKVSSFEYVKHLILLRHYDEKDLLSKTIALNEHIFAINEILINKLYFIFKMYKLCKEYKLITYTNKKGGNDYSTLRSFLRNERELIVKLINKLFKFQKIPTSSYTVLFDYITILNLNDNDIIKIYHCYESLTGNNNKNTLFNSSSNNNKKQPFELVYNELSTINEINYSIYYDVTPSDYISRIDNIQFHHNDINNNNNVHEVTLIFYKISNTILSGSIFGENCLSKQSNRTSTYTVITSSNCYFGIINYHDYTTCVRCSIERIRSLHSKFFLKSAIFRNINQNIFEMKYYNLFTQRQFHKGDIILSKHSKQKEIYFLYQGEIDIAIECSMKHLYSILLTLSKEPNPIDNRIKTMIHLNDAFKEYFENYKSTFSLSKYKYNEILGLDDFLLENNQNYLFDCVCSSSIVECFYMDYNSYEMTLNDNLIKSNVNEFVCLKRKILCERINVILETCLNNYSNKYLSRDSKTPTKSSYNPYNKRKRKINDKVLNNSTQKIIKLKTNNTEYNNSNNFTKVYEQPPIEKSFDFPTLKNIYKPIPFYKKLKHKKTQSLHNKKLNNENINSFSNEVQSDHGSPSPNKNGISNLKSIYRTFYSSVPSLKEIKVKGYNDLSGSFKRDLRTKKVIVVKSNKGNKSVHENKIKYYDNKTVYNNDIYMKMNHLLFNRVLLSEGNSSRKENNKSFNGKCIRKDKNKGFIDCLCLDKLIEKHCNYNNIYNYK